MSDPAIIEAAARALCEADDRPWEDRPGDDPYILKLRQEGRADYRRFAAAMLPAVTPLIEAAALERAAKVAEDKDPFGPSPIAAAIRALITKDSGGSD